MTKFFLSSVLFTDEKYAYNTWEVKYVHSVDYNILEGKYIYLNKITNLM